MKRILFLLFFAGAWQFAGAQQPPEGVGLSPGGVRLSDAEIRAVLANATAVYRSGARQFFAKDGRTYYLEADALSAGKWHVADDKYCSVWGPNTRTPTCYIVSRHGKNAETAAPILRWDGGYEAEIIAGDLLRPKSGE